MATITGWPWHMAKKISVAVLLLLLSANVSAQQLSLSSASKVSFVIKNFGVKVDGSLSGISGTAVWDPNNLSSANFTASVKSATVNTGIGSRDSHLKKEDYFHVDKFPTITISSTKIQASTKAGTYIFQGNLNINGTSKPIRFPFTVVSTGNGYSFSGSFSLNRRDFGVGGSSISLSDDVVVKIDAVATR